MTVYVLILNATDMEDSRATESVICTCASNSTNTFPPH